MRHLIFVFVFLIHLQLVSSLTPQKACEGFLINLWKYAGLSDTNILHPDFKRIDKNGIDTTDEYINHFFSGKVSAEYRKKYEKALENKNNFWEKYWDQHIARFVEKDMLELKRFSNHKLTHLSLYIRDPNIQGGYKMFKQTLY